MNVSTPILYYNRAHFARAGLDPDDPPGTLQELHDAAVALKQAGIPKPLSFKIDRWFFDTWITGVGQDIVNNGDGREAQATEGEVDSETAIDLLTFLQQMNADGLMNPFADTEGSIDHYLALINQDSSMVIETSVAAPTIRDALGGNIDPSEAGLDAAALEGVDLSPAPALPGIEQPGQVRASGGAFYILNTSEPAVQAASWKFLRYMLEPENAREWYINGGYLPVDPRIVRGPRGSGVRQRRHVGRAAAGQLRPDHHGQPRQPRPADRPLQGRRRHGRGGDGVGDPRRRRPRRGPAQRQRQGHGVAPALPRGCIGAPCAHRAPQAPNAEGCAIDEPWPSRARHSARTLRAGVPWPDHGRALVPRPFLHPQGVAGHQLPLEHPAGRRRRRRRRARRPAGAGCGPGRRAGLRGARAGGDPGRGRPAARADRPVHRAGAVAPVRAGRAPHPQPLRRAGPRHARRAAARQPGVDRRSGSTPRSRRTTGSPSGARPWPRPDARSTCRRIDRQRAELAAAGAPEAEAEPGAADDPGAAPADSVASQVAASLDAQRAAADRLDGVQQDAQARLRLLDARMDEALVRAVELSAQSGPSAELGGLGADVDSLVTDMEALRQALEEANSASGGLASPGGTA